MPTHSVEMTMTALILWYTTGLILIAYCPLQYSKSVRTFNVSRCCSFASFLLLIIFIVFSAIHIATWLILSMLHDARHPPKQNKHFDNSHTLAFWACNDNFIQSFYSFLWKTSRPIWFHTANIYRHLSIKGNFKINV